MPRQLDYPTSDPLSRVSPCRSPTPSVSFSLTNRLIDRRSLSHLETNTNCWPVKSTPECVFPSDYLLLFTTNNFCSSLRRRSMVFRETFFVIWLASVISSSKRNTHTSPSSSAGTWSASYSPPIVANNTTHLLSHGCAPFGIVLRNCWFSAPAAQVPSCEAKLRGKGRLVLSWECRSNLL